MSELAEKVALSIDRLKYYEGLQHSESYYLAFSGGKDKKEVKGMNISDLVIYDEQKELREFTPRCKYMLDGMKCDPADVACLDQSDYEDDKGLCYCLNFVRRPPQSWCYVEELT